MPKRNQTKHQSAAKLARRHKRFRDKLRRIEAIQQRLALRGIDLNVIRRPWLGEVWSFSESGTALLDYVPAKGRCEGLVTGRTFRVRSENEAVYAIDQEQSARSYCPDDLRQ